MPSAMIKLSLSVTLSWQHRHKEFDEGEQQFQRLRQEVAGLMSQSTPRVEQSVPNRDPELAVRLSQLEEGMKAQQRAMKQLKKDNAEDAKEVKQYLDQVHDLSHYNPRGSWILDPRAGCRRNDKIVKGSSKRRLESRRRGQWLLQGGRDCLHWRPRGENGHG